MTCPLGDCIGNTVHKPNMHQHLFFPELYKDDPSLNKDSNFTGLHKCLKFMCMCVYLCWSVCLKLREG